MTGREAAIVSIVDGIPVIPAVELGEGHRLVRRIRFTEESSSHRFELSKRSGKHEETFHGRRSTLVIGLVVMISHASTTGCRESVMKDVGVFPTKGV